MLKRIALLLASILILSLTVEAYTVILKKNGKLLNGTLVSENETTIVFKDEQGLQYSLNKSALDLEKMAEANAPPPAPAPAPPAEPAPAPAEPQDNSKKPAKVYTAADVDALREKYANIAPSTASGAGMSDPTESPEAYYRTLLESVALITDSINNLGQLVDGMNTAWEVASSTGKEPVSALRAYKSGTAYSGTIANVRDVISELDSSHDAMSKPPSDNLKKGYDAMGSALSSLQSYMQAVQAYDGSTPIADFRSNTNSISNKVDTAIQDIQKVEAPAGAAPEPNQQ